VQRRGDPPGVEHDTEEEILCRRPFRGEQQVQQHNGTQAQPNNFEQLSLPAISPGCTREIERFPSSPLHHEKKKLEKTTRPPFIITIAHPHGTLLQRYNKREYHNLVCQSVWERRTHLLHGAALQRGLHLSENEASFMG
jgi:hypothetical protein